MARRSLTATTAALTTIGRVAATLTPPTTPPKSDGAPHASLSARRRLAPDMPSDRAMSWLWTALITGVALVLRLINLRSPAKVIFDEVYYSKDAHDLLRHAVELNGKENGPGFVAHPPFGKWCIAMGEWLFGYNSLGWRVPAVIAGAISVLLIIRIARRMFRSTLLGCVAGLLLTLDGLHFVMSRVALLDVFLMLFVLVAFGFLVLDRDARRADLLRQLESGADLRRGTPGRRWATVAWWRLAAGVAVGLALGVKWSAMWFIPAFVLLAFVWEVQARRTAGVRRPIYDTIGREVGWLFAFIGLLLATYLLTWTGWFVTSTGWDRHWAETTGHEVWWAPDALVNLWHYQKAVYEFHTHLTQKHDYQSTPWSWFVLGRPVAFYYSPDGNCGASKCSAEILALGNPLLWWSFVPALVACVWRWLARRDWTAGAILLCAAAGIVPWMFYPDRTMFFFYTLPALPFLVLAVTLVLGMVLGPATAARDRRVTGAVALGAYVLVVALAFAYFYPIYTGEVMTYAKWHARMWFDSWI